LLLYGDGTVTAEIAFVIPEFPVLVKIPGCEQIHRQRFDPGRCGAITRRADETLGITNWSAGSEAQGDGRARNLILVDIRGQRRAPADALEIHLCRLLRLCVCSREDCRRQPDYLTYAVLHKFSHLLCNCVPFIRQYKDRPWLLTISLLQPEDNTRRNTACRGTLTVMAQPNMN
jgi:hypothetical protein